MAEPTPTLRRRRTVIGTNVLVQIVAVLALMVMINWLVARHYVRFDWTSSGYYKLAGMTQQVLGKLPQPVKVIVYLQPSTEAEMDAKIYDDVRNLLKEFKFFGKDKLVIEYVDPDRDRARADQIADEYKFDLREPTFVIFACGAQHKFVNREEMVDLDRGAYGAPPRIRAFKAEGAFLSAIQAVTEGVPPVIYFLTGHGEKDPASFDQTTGYSMLGTYIKRQNLTLQKWNLQDEQTIPTNASALVIAGPRTKYTDGEQKLLEQYLKNRGRLLVMVDPKAENGLEPLLRNWGVQIDNDLVMRKLGTLMGNELIDVNAVATSYAQHPVTESLAGVNTRFSEARSVHALKRPAPGADQPRVTELAKTSKAFWGETDFESESVSYDAARDLTGPLCLAVAVEAGQPRDVNVDLGVSRLIVVGTSSFVDNSDLTQGNLDFFMNSLNWLLKREQLLAVGPKTPEELRLDMSDSQMSAVYWLSMWGLPAAVGILGLAVWLRRRR